MQIIKVNVVTQYSSDRGMRPIKIITPDGTLIVKSYTVTEDAYPGLSEFAHKHDSLIQYECVVAGGRYTHVLLRYILHYHLWLMVVR